MCCLVRGWWWELSNGGITTGKETQQKLGEKSVLVSFRNQDLIWSCRGPKASHSVSCELWAVSGLLLIRTLFSSINYKYENSRSKQLKLTFSTSKKITKGVSKTWPPRSPDFTQSHLSMGLRKTFKSEIDDTDHLKLRIREAVRIQKVLSWRWNESRKRVFIGQSGEWDWHWTLLIHKNFHSFSFTWCFQH